MSSLQSIMNLDDDQQDASSPMDKKDKDTTTPASGFRDQDPSGSTPTGHNIHTGRQHSASLSYTSHPAQQHIDLDQGSSSTVQQGKRPIETSAATAILPATSLGYGDSRRQSSTSVDSMDPHGYGSAASSSSVGGGPGSGGYPIHAPRRPMGTSPGPEVPVRLTPITGRVSRAKKGVPVHICNQCNPPKTFTRAEHLRRHQLSHQNPQFPCTYPGCKRAFHRQDLLSRHELRHTQEGDELSGRRMSDTPGTLEEPMSGMNVGNLPPSNPYSSAAGSMSSTTPSTPPPGSSSRSAMSSLPEGHDQQYRPSSSHPPSNSFEYELHAGIPVINQPTSSLESSPEPPSFSGMDNMAPRITPMSLYGVAQSLSPSASLHALVEPPELDYSWTSNSESSYSTPSEMPRARFTQRHQPQPTIDWSTNNTLLPTVFPAEDRREIGANGGVQLMTTPYYLTTPFSVSPHLAPAPHTPYGPLLGEPLMAGFAEEQVQLLDPAITGHHGIHQGSPSVRSSSPSISISVSGQAADTLVTPAPLHRIEPMARVSRQKELAIGGGTPDVTMGVLGSQDDNPNWTGSSPAGTGMTTGQGLSGLHGSSIGRVPALARPLGAILNAVPSYIEVYWKHAHPGLPIVHRPSFEMAGEEALRYAMAALATQYLNSKEDRIRGSQLHEYAWQEAKRCPPGNIQGMQAILICEYYARFRGRKAVVRPSKAFESLYLRVVDHSLDLFDTTMTPSTTGFGHQQQKAHMAATREQRWRSWLDAEAYRRLLAACFCLDHHASAYHQQPRAKNDVSISDIPLTGQTDALWAAGSIDEWYALLEAEPAAGAPTYLPRLDLLRSEDVSGYSIFDQEILLSAEFSGLENQRFTHSATERPSPAEDLRTPTTASYAAELLKFDKHERAASLFSKSLVAPIANVYVALRHTPLHDLLAVSGDSWVFSQKVLGAPAFLEHQKRLKAWAEGRSSSSASPTSTTNTTTTMQPTSPTTAASLEGLSSAKASIYAARTLVGLLDGLHCQGPRPYVGCISTYWAIYVCALIIWAYGHHRATGGSGSNKASGSNNNSAGSAPHPVSSSSSSSSSSGGSPNKGAPMSQEETVNWLRVVADLGQPENLARIRGRREASAGVVSMVKTMLEGDCVGGRSRLYVDATVVLRKLEEGVNWRWF